MVSYGLVYHIFLGLHRPASLRFLCNFWKTLFYHTKRGRKVPPFSCPLCCLLHTVYDGIVCRNGNHLQILIGISGSPFRLLYKPPQRCACFLCPQTDDGRMPRHHHSAVCHTGNLHQGFLYLLGSLLGTFRHRSQTGSCLLPRTAAKEEKKQKNNIFFQISTPISLLSYPGKMLSHHGKSSGFFRKKTVYRHVFVLQ